MSVWYRCFLFYTRKRRKIILIAITLCIEFVFLFPIFLIWLCIQHMCVSYITWNLLQYFFKSVLQWFKSILTGMQFSPPSNSSTLHLQNWNSISILFISFQFFSAFHFIYLFTLNLSIVPYSGTLWKGLCVQTTQSWGDINRRCCYSGNNVVTSRSIEDRKKNNCLLKTEARRHSF